MPVHPDIVPPEQFPSGKHNRRGYFDGHPPAPNLILSCRGKWHREDKESKEEEERRKKKDERRKKKEERRRRYIRTQTQRHRHRDTDTDKDPATHPSSTACSDLSRKKILSLSLSYYLSTISLSSDMLFFLPTPIHNLFMYVPSWFFFCFIPFRFIAMIASFF